MTPTPTPRCDALDDQLQHDTEASRDFELLCFAHLARDLERQLAELTDRWERAANAYMIEQGKHEETQRQLAAERALADRLAETIQSLPSHVKANINPQALAAWKEARGA